MKFESKTKKQLIGLLVKHEITIENKSKLIDDLLSQKKGIIEERHNFIKQIEDQKQLIITKNIENIADIKSIKDMLNPFIDETLTHNEKRYLGRHFDLILKKKIEKKLSDIDINYKASPDLPF